MRYKYPEQQEEGLEAFPALQLALPEHCLLIAQNHIRSLFYFYFSFQQDTPPSLMVHQQFTPTEWRVLLPLLRGFPSITSYEVLLAALLRIKQAESRELTRLNNGSLREILRPLRDTVSRLRTKVQPFSFDIATRTGRGYVITVPEPVATRAQR
jgi:hypothetical protein